MFNLVPDFIVILAIILFIFYMPYGLYKAYKDRYKNDSDDNHKTGKR